MTNFQECVLDEAPTKCKTHGSTAAVCGSKHCHEIFTDIDWTRSKRPISSKANMEAVPLASPSCYSASCVSLYTCTRVVDSERAGCQFVYPTWLKQLFRFLSPPAVSSLDSMQHLMVEDCGSSLADGAPLSEVAGQGKLGRLQLERTEVIRLKDIFMSCMGPQRQTVTQVSRKSGREDVGMARKPFLSSFRGNLGDVMIYSQMTNPLLHCHSCG